MRLYHHPASSNARRVAMTAQVLGLDLELVLVDLMSEDDRRRLVEINPNSKVPVLQDGDFLLWESHAIMQYLCDASQGARLYPTALRERADVNRWLFWSGQHWSPALGMFVWENLWKGLTGNGAADPVELAKAKLLLEEYAPVLERHLAERSWICGSALSLADLSIAAPLMYIDKGGLPLQAYPNILAWFARVQALPAWEKTQMHW